MQTCINQINQTHCQYLKFTGEADSIFKHLTLSQSESLFLVASRFETEYGYAEFVVRHHYVYQKTHLVIFSGWYLVQFSDETFQSYPPRLFHQLFKPTTEESI